MVLGHQVEPCPDLDFPVGKRFHSHLPLVGIDIGQGGHGKAQVVVQGMPRQYGQHNEGDNQEKYHGTQFVRLDIGAKTLDLLFRKQDGQGDDGKRDGDLARSAHDYHAEKKGDHRRRLGGGAGAVIAICPVTRHYQGKHGGQSADDQPGGVVQYGQVGAQGAQQREQHEIANAERYALFVAHFALEADEKTQDSGQAELSKEIDQVFAVHRSLLLHNLITVSCRVTCGVIAGAPAATTTAGRRGPWYE